MIGTTVRRGEVLPHERDTLKVNVTPVRITPSPIDSPGAGNRRRGTWGESLSGEFTKSNDQKIAFVLAETLLRDIAETVSKELVVADSLREDAAAPLQYDVELIESGEFSTDSIAEVLGLPNSGAKRIKAITIRTKYWAKPRVFFRFRDVDFVPSVTYRVTGEEKQVFYLSAQLDDLIRRSRSWYSRLAHLDAVQAILSLLLVLWVLFIVGATALVLTGAFDDTASTSARDTILANGIGLAGLALLLALGGVLNKLRTWLFPVGIFSIGDDHDRVERLRFWRGFFGVGLIVAMGVNIVTTLLFG